MSTTLEFDEEAAQRLSALYTTPEVIARRRAALDALQLQPGERALDIGSGPGFLSTEMAAQIGPTGFVQGIDLSPDMLSLARARAAAEGVGGWAAFQPGDATRLPVKDAAVDVAAATQVYEYVDDIAEALSEAHRALRPGGRMVIIDTDWDSIVWQARDMARMRRILAAWDEHLVYPYLPRTLSVQLRRAGFEVKQVKILPVLNTEYSANTYSGGMINLISAFVPGRQGITQEEVEAWRTDLEELSEEGAYFFSICQYLFVATKDGT
jgi:ubiquinone/menaquinone biosynthesis C-methylase UbiE